MKVICCFFLANTELNLYKIYLNIKKVTYHQIRPRRLSQKKFKMIHI